MWAIQESGEDFPSKLGGLFFFGMKEGGAEAEAGEGVALGFVKVGGGISDIFEFLVGFCVFPSVFSKICFGENGLWGQNPTLNLKCFWTSALFNYTKRLFFSKKKKKY